MELTSFKLKEDPLNHAHTHNIKSERLECCYRVFYN